MTADVDVDDDDELAIWSIVADCEDDPDAFNTDVLCRAEYWGRQKDICAAVVRHKIVVCPTGNSVGKSFVAAGLIPWWLYTQPGSSVVCTAPSQTLLGTVLFKELRRAMRSCPFYPDVLPGDITHSPKVSPQTFTIDETGWGALGIATTGVERLSGQHDPNLLQIVDEASGIEEEIWEALESQNPAKLVVFGNPLKSTGRFPQLYRRALREANDPTIPDEEKCVAIRIPSTESPDIDLPRSPRGLADRGFLQEAERNYGRDSLYWKTHIDAEFPDTDTAKLVVSSWLDRCERAGLNPNHPRKGNVRIAVDLGGGNQGDYTVILVRDDNGILALDWSNTWTLETTATRVALYAQRYRVEPIRISFDMGGIGHDFANRLRAVGIIGALGYMGGRSGGKRFNNLRSAAAWLFRMRLNPGTRDRDGKELAPFAIRPEWMLKLRPELEEIEYSEKDGKTAIEPREHLIERLGHSPDFADVGIQSWAYLT